jgi:hypothetical protein
MTTFTVNNLSDSGLGSLREAIIQANSTAGIDSINFNSGLAGGTINLTGGELGITEALNLNGLGADLLTIDAGGKSRIFSNYNSNVSIDGLKVSNGYVDLYGGAFYNSGTLNLTNSTITGNSAGSSGGAVLNEGILNISRSTLSNNSSDYGGAIWNDPTATVNIIDSTLSGNSVDGEAGGGGGGAIYNYGGLNVTNSTMSNNSADYGGGISNEGMVNLVNSTIAGNFGGTDGGGIYNESILNVSNSTISGNSADSGAGISNYEFDSQVTVTSSIVAGNSGNQDLYNEQPDFSSFISGGSNLIGNGEGETAFINGVNGDIVGTSANPISPLLGSLQNNGGFTETMALLPGSRAIDAGSNPLGLRLDQRGFNRSISQTDIGAFESQTQAVPEPSSTVGLWGLAILGFICCRQRQQRKSRL